MALLNLLHLPSFLALLALTSALPSYKPIPTPLPLIVWHGLGDRYDADGLQSTGTLAQQVHPGTYVYYIRTDDDGGNDRTNTFFGNLTTQIDDVCDALHANPKLRASSPDGEGLRVDALGFSQGGQFLRGLLERCDGLSVRSLVTFGSQHNGIAQFQHCGTFDYLCKGATALVKGNAWTDYVQNKVVPAQYYRTVNETTGMASDEYLEHSNFLADVNNEREVKSEVYKARVAALEKFVMYVFEEDVTVIPKESGWFAEVNETSGEVIPLRERTMYKEDWLGLRELDDEDGLVFRTTSGKHMALTDKVLRQAFGEFFGPEREEERLEVSGLKGVETAMPAVDGRILFSCGSDRAQSKWDSMSQREQWRWNWDHVTKPWLRGEWMPVSGSKRARPQEQQKVRSWWHQYL